ncbi:hypothetical protein HRbin32_01488 [bacterium HR32]|nr:hypothetical protein HRbin32_01488 [bacterium HR32]
MQRRTPRGGAGPSPVRAAGPRRRRAGPVPPRGDSPPGATQPAPPTLRPRAPLPPRWRTGRREGLRHPAHSRRSRRGPLPRSPPRARGIPPLPRLPGLARSGFPALWPRTACARRAVDRTDSAQAPAAWPRVLRTARPSAGRWHAPRPRPPARPPGPSTPRAGLAPPPKGPWPPPAPPRPVPGPPGTGAATPEAHRCARGPGAPSPVRRGPPAAQAASGGAARPGPPVPPRTASERPAPCTAPWSGTPGRTACPAAPRGAPGRPPRSPRRPKTRPSVPGAPRPPRPGTRPR